MTKKHKAMLRCSVSVATIGAGKFVMLENGKCMDTAKFGLVGSGEVRSVM